MILTIVGCAGSFANATSPASCYLVEHDGHRLVIDLGNGALGALQPYVDTGEPASLSAVLLSHCHLDHCADVGGLFVQRKYNPAHRARPLPLLGPAEAAARLAAIYGMDVDELAPVFDVGPFAAGPLEVGPFTIEVAPAAHPVEAYSLRITAGGRSLVYSGDTGPSERLVDLARDCDLALFEASYVGEGHEPGVHMTGADAARAAAAAGAGRLVLTHLVAWNDSQQVLAEALPHVEVPVELARPGLTITV